MADPREHSELAPVLDLARRAGESLLERFRQQDLAVDFKGPRDLVTEADLAAESLIKAGLREHFGSVSVLAEENPDAEPRDPNAPLWIVDPLDGTTNFAHGHPLFAVSIALCENDRPQLAVTHAPALGETYAAARGQGAWSFDRFGSAPRRLRVSEEQQLSRALLATGFSYGRREIEAGGLRVFGRLLAAAREIRRGGSACLDLAHAAAGIFAGFWEYHLKPHDVAAGILLIEEAGGVVTDVRGDDDCLHGASLVAGNETIHAQLLEALADGPDHPGRPS